MRVTVEPNLFDCRDISFLNRDHIFFNGIPSLVTAIINISVSFYIAYKMAKKKSPKKTNLQLRAARYQTSDDNVFMEVPTVSRAIQNQDDLFLENIEEYADDNQQVSCNNLSMSMRSSSQTEVLSPKMNETDAEIEIKRVNSAPDMFYRVPVETSQPESVLPCFPSLTLETLKTVLKINLMTLESIQKFGNYQ